MTNQFSFYLKILFAIIVCALTCVVLINWMVDPYNELGRNKTGLYFVTDRQQKNSIVQVPHDAILIGSSRTLHINPDDLCGYHFYNASFSSALPEEIYAYLDRYAHQEKIVVIGLDFYMFNEHSYPLDPITTWPTRLWPVHEYLLGWDVLKASLQALVNWQQKVPVYAVNNGYSPLTDSASVDTVFYSKMLKHLASTHYRKATLSVKRLEIMKRLTTMLTRRGISYRIFINPLQQDDLQLLANSDSYQIFNQWKLELTKLIPELIDLSKSKYSSKEYFHRSDPSHYLPSTGAKFLNEILSCTR